MGSSSIGRLFTYTTFGESHGEALGVIIEGFPPLFTPDLDKIQEMMDRRRPGSTRLGTQRDEKDRIKVLSGLYLGKTTGAPICILIENHDQRSNDYKKIFDEYRPGHADYTFEARYGIRDPRGGGRSSARETSARVMAGALAAQYLESIGIKINAAVVSVGGIEAKDYAWDPPFPSPLYAPRCKEAKEMEALIEEVKREQDSVGCTIECRIENVPPGLGDPVFDKLDALLARAIFSLGAVKGFEIGSGFSASSSRGSSNNDQMCIRSNSPTFITNNAGGILGGISNGEEIRFKTYFKPTPSISREQRTINKNNEEVTMTITGRHDPCVGPRAVVVVEAMAASVILDALLIKRAYSAGSKNEG